MRKFINPNNPNDYLFAETKLDINNRPYAKLSTGKKIYQRNKNEFYFEELGKRKIYHYEFTNNLIKLTDEILIFKSVDYKSEWSWISEREIITSFDRLTRKWMFKFPEDNKWLEMKDKETIILYIGLDNIKSTYKIKK